MREVVRLSRDGFLLESEEWEVESQPHTVTVYRVGWVTFEALKSTSSGRWHVSLKAQEALPESVFAALPEAVKALDYFKHSRP